MDKSKRCQVILATHSPVLMAQCGADGIHEVEPTTIKLTDHYRAPREFRDDLKGFVEAAIGE